ncbi:MAG: FHA domain-containing protein [Acidimicrobiia bacterium]|nr:FHA domain-containing protein [Acidimicrobiia bacterium]
MSLARSLERRIEQLVEGIGTKVFRGQLHPIEVAIRIVREAELALTNTGVGPAAPNAFAVSLNPADLGDDADQVVLRLNKVVAEAARERGWRLEGPPLVTLTATSNVAEGAMAVETAIRPGLLDPWGSLIETRGPRRLHLTKNRSLVGRSRRADVMLGDETVSRTHSLLWHDAGGMWIQDLASSNGTTVNGGMVGEPAELHDGDVIGFGETRFGFRSS